MTRLLSQLAGSGILLLCLCDGCMSSKPVTVGQWARGDKAVIRHAPESAVYKVMWLSADRRERRDCVGAERVIARGEPLGFATNQDGHVTAIAGDERIPLVHLPSHARYCQWQYTRVRETHFGKGVDATGKIIAGGARLPVDLVESLPIEFGTSDDNDAWDLDWINRTGHDNRHETGPAPEHRNESDHGHGHVRDE